MDTTFDVFDGIVFLVIVVTIIAGIVLVVTLGQLPGQIAAKRGHPQASAINVAGWIGVATMGILWPLALIWAFAKPMAEVRRESEVSR